MDLEMISDILLVLIMVAFGLWNYSLMNALQHLERDVQVLKYNYDHDRLGR